MTFEKEVVIDGRGHLLGRLASIVAKVRRPPLRKVTWLAVTRGGRGGGERAVVGAGLGC